MAKEGLLVGIFVLMWAASASAECAWVLWRYERSVPGAPSGVTWAVDDTADTRAACEGLRTRAVMNSATEPELRQILLPTGVIYYDEHSKVVRHRSYLCLPDTLDPRPRAWVLWGARRAQEGLRDARAWWVLPPTHLTQQDCEVHRGAVHRARLSDGVSFECLPDTVDPRGPKASGR